MIKEVNLELQQITGGDAGKRWHICERKEGGIIETRGKRLVDFTSWDFFCLNKNPRFKRLSQVEIENSGISTCASRLSTGTTIQHVSCESALAKFLGRESAVFFSSRNQVVLSLITSFVAEQDVVFFEELSQSPIADAAYLVNAPAVSFSAENLSLLRSELEKNKAARRKFIFVESISPVTGKILELPAVASLAQKFGGNLIIDESCALGVVGVRGSGCLGAPSAPDNIAILCEYADLSQGMGAFGAFLAGDKILIESLVGRSRTIAVETATPPFLAAAVEGAIDIIERQPLAREKLGSLAVRLRRGLAALGFSGVDESPVPVVCVAFQTNRQAKELSEALFQRGFLAEILSQKLPLSNRAIVRFIIYCAHSDRQIDELLQNISVVTVRLKAGN